MILKRLSIVFFFCLLSFHGNTQDLSLKIDSLKIYHLPLSMRSVLSLSDNDVRNFSETIQNQALLKTELIEDSLTICEFIQTEFSNEANVSDFEYSIDVRIVIDVYLEHGIRLTITMDDKGYYLIENEKIQRSRNRKLITWLQKHIPELK